MIRLADIREASTMEEDSLVLNGRACVVSVDKPIDGLQRAIIVDTERVHQIVVCSYLDSEFFEKNVLRAAREFGEKVG